MWNFGGHCCFRPWKPDFFAKSDIWIPKCTNGGGGSNGLGNIPKYNRFFYALPKFRYLFFWDTLMHIQEHQKRTNKVNCCHMTVSKRYAPSCLWTVAFKNLIIRKTFVVTARLVGSGQELLSFYATINSNPGPTPVIGSNSLPARSWNRLKHKFPATT